MGGGFTPRFAFEIVFLVLLAVTAGLADLSALAIGLVMAGAWLLLTLVEWLAWRAETSAEQQPPAWSGFADEPDELDGWDIQEILAPLPQEGASGREVDGLTSVLPPEVPAEPEDERS